VNVPTQRDVPAFDNANHDEPDGVPQNLVMRSRSAQSRENSILTSTFSTGETPT